MERELHLTERPTSFKQVVGQDEAVAQLTALGRAKGIPHCLLFTGPSGCGKTTLARIVKHKLKCSDMDFTELNCAQDRGIEMVRSIQHRVGLAPIGGPCRVWLIDECQQMTPDAQGAFLKLLEEPPNHVYFMLCTTDPQKLKNTIITRSTHIRLGNVAPTTLAALAQRVHADHKDGAELVTEVAERLADVAEGSPRKALVLLQAIMHLATPEAQVAALGQADAKRKAFEIAQAIMRGSKWPTVAAILKEVDEDPEGIRHMMLAYFSKVALGGGKNAARAVAVMEEFADNYYDSKRAGLVISCFNATTV